MVNLWEFAYDALDGQTYPVKFQTIIWVFQNIFWGKQKKCLLQSFPQVINISQYHVNYINFLVLILYYSYTHHGNLHDGFEEFYILFLPLPKSL